MDDFCGSCSYIAVMPGFIDDAGDVGFLRRIPQDIAVFPAVVLQPELRRVVVLGGIDIGIGCGADVNRETKFVLACSRHGYRCGGLGFRGSFVHALVNVHLDGIVEI